MTQLSKNQWTKLFRINCVFLLLLFFYFAKANFCLNLICRLKIIYISNDYICFPGNHPNDILTLRVFIEFPEATFSFNEFPPSKFLSYSSLVIFSFFRSKEIILFSRKNSLKTAYIKRSKVVNIQTQHFRHFQSIN